MKPPKHIVKLGIEAINLWKLQQVLGKQNDKTNKSNTGLDRGVVRPS